jgi:hypothetical protein
MARGQPRAFARPSPSSRSPNMIIVAGIVVIAALVGYLVVSRKKTKA